MLRKWFLTLVTLSILCLCGLVPAASAQMRIAVRTLEGLPVPPYGTPLDLGSVPVGGFIDKGFRIYNEGTVPIFLGAPPVWTGYNSQFFILTPPSTNYLAPGFNTSFTVRFISSYPGFFGNVVAVKYGDSASQNQQFFFNVQATAQGAGMNVVSADGFSIVPGSTYTFPNTSPGVQVSREIRIFNTGNIPLTISNFTLSTAGGFVVLIYPPTSIDPQQTGTFRIRLHAASPGTYTGTVTFNNNVAGLSPFQFFLRGTVGTPDIRVMGPGGVTLTNGSLFVMPSTPVSVQVSRAFTIYNDGNAPLTISNPTSLVSGQKFSLIVQPPATINPGGSGEFRVRLHSSIAGTYTGTVTIQSNDPDENPLTFSLQGTVTP